MSETPTNVTPPPDLTYGYVDGRIILAIGDRSDAGRMPDPVPADGMTVTLTPANTILKVTTPTPATVIKQPIVCNVDADGYLIDGQAARGVWLVTGTYKVTYSHSRAIIPSHDIEVTTGHTEAAPLDLTTAMPPGGPVLAPSEYAELNGRITILEAGTIRARKSIRDFLKPVQIDSDAATLAQVDDPASFIASPGSVVWDNYAAIGYPAGNPVPVTPGTPYSPGCRLFTTGGGNVQSLPMSFYANGKIGIHVTLWADTDVWVSIDGRPVSADPFIIRQADTATFQPFVTIALPDDGGAFHRYDITLGWGANLIQIINEPGALMTAGEAPTFRLGLTGDSYADSGIGPYYGGPAQTLRQFTGVNVIPLGQGSTGYTNDGSSSGDLTKEVFGGTNRLAAIAGAELDALIVVGSVNDGGSTPVATKAAALAFYAAVSPLPVIVVGVEPLYDAADPTYAGWDALNDALIEAADEAPNVIGFVDWRGEDWLTGTGSQSNIQYDGNQDWAIGDVAGTDTIHPSHAGWKLLLIPRLIEAIAPMEI